MRVWIRAFCLVSFLALCFPLFAETQAEFETVDKALTALEKHLKDQSIDNPEITKILERISGARLYYPYADAQEELTHTLSSPSAFLGQLQLLKLPEKLQARQEADLEAFSTLSLKGIRNELRLKKRIAWNLIRVNTWVLQKFVLTGELVKQPFAQTLANQDYFFEPEEVTNDMLRNRLEEWKRAQIGENRGRLSAVQMVVDAILSVKNVDDETKRLALQAYCSSLLQKPDFVRYLGQTVVIPSASEQSLQALAALQSLARLDSPLNEDEKRAVLTERHDAYQTVMEKIGDLSRHMRWALQP